MFELIFHDLAEVNKATYPLADQKFAAEKYQQVWLYIFH